ncbi:hypothetical protein ACFXPY_24200 [Streptomyces sp. NPDC059153]|uniref:hypothetical protein n=1 Tax=unclassified Streptomyces TaxID=2593676 RepID=UPI0036880776
MSPPGSALGDYWAYWLGGVAAHRFRENSHPAAPPASVSASSPTAAPRRTPDSRSRTYAPSSSGSTASELLRESALRRDVAYGDHETLVEEFQACVRAQNVTPSAMRELTSTYTELKEEPAVVTHDLTKERAATATLRRIVAELGLELQQAREEIEQSGNVTRLPAPRRRASRR